MWSVPDSSKDLHLMQRRDSCIMFSGYSPRMKVVPPMDRWSTRNAGRTTPATNFETSSWFFGSSSLSIFCAPSSIPAKEFGLKSSPSLLDFRKIRLRRCVPLDVRMWLAFVIDTSSLYPLYISSCWLWYPTSSSSPSRYVSVCELLLLTGLLTLPPPKTDILAFLKPAFLAVLAATFFECVNSFTAPLIPFLAPFPRLLMLSILPSNYQSIN
mmetsp:Transcript_13222/g.28010  ORF Transcript_13222/g.28010 Transcript_13222/m.28010 type:complete len:212 (-) Transcript_13222:55-690(-)